MSENTHFFAVHGREPGELKQALIRERIPAIIDPCEYEAMGRTRFSELPENRRWLLLLTHTDNWGRLTGLIERLAEIGRGRIIVSEPHRREQVSGVLEEALGRVFAERFASATAQRFEESAYVSWKSGAVEDARACLAAARLFREKAPAENPVARTMLEVLLEPVLSKIEEETKSEEERSLLVKP